MPAYELNSEQLARNRMLLLRAVKIEIPALFRYFCDELQPLYSDAVRVEGREDVGCFLNPRGWSALQELTIDKKMAILRDAILSWCHRHRIDESQWLEDPLFFYDVCLTTLAFREYFVVGKVQEDTPFDYWMDYQDVLEAVDPLHDADADQRKEVRRAFAEGVKRNPDAWRETSNILQARGKALFGSSISDPEVNAVLEGVGLPTARPRDSFRIDFDRWDPKEQPWSDFATGLRRRFEDGLKQYRAVHEANMKRRGVVKAEVKDLEHFRWLALAMFGGQGFKPLSIKEVHEEVYSRRFDEQSIGEYGEDDFGDSTIKKGIREAAIEAGIRSPVKQGRPAK